MFGLSPLRCFCVLLSTLEQEVTCNDGDPYKRQQFVLIEVTIVSV